MPASTLKKKSNTIAYHFIREGCARNEWRTAYVNTNNNVADCLTNPLAGQKWSKFVQMLLHHVGGICLFARIRPCFHDSVDRVRPAKLVSWS